MSIISQPLRVKSKGLSTNFDIQKIGRRYRERKSIGNLGSTRPRELVDSRLLFLISDLGVFLLMPNEVAELLWPLSFHLDRRAGSRVVEAQRLRMQG